ncbi:hypothetical protein F511_14082 [Dorcoceras hygrometricum]|uniref:Uncharacterized protein n=1 Tax=Dorcoceras hygrometricum TaxID=472368 RepID=A0A2Z7BR12_9LAMI|nr:hypothetical protein F511_14082 [Dorcoceras hygrometricum]
MACRKRRIPNDEDVCAPYKEWDEASRPICMDHPHNAILLICSSHDNGCHPYICDTSYWHSNCLDRFKKLREEKVDCLSALSSVQESQHDAIIATSRNVDPTIEVNDSNLNISLTASSSAALAGMPGGSGLGATHNVNPNFEDQETSSLESLDRHETNMEKSEDGSNLICPLCRGNILCWKVVEDARKYLNLKARSCSHESCSFVGNYNELRRHARSIHPTVRPADVDPLRQSAWHMLERQREYNDIVSAIRSAMPGAIVLGDYAIDNGDRLLGERDNEGGRWLSTFFLFHMIGSIDSRAERRGGRSRMLPRYRRAARTISRHRYLWGENLLGLQDDEDHDEEDGDDELDLSIQSDIGGDAPPYPRRRRRLTRSQSDEDQP